MPTIQFLEKKISNIILVFIFCNKNKLKKKEGTKRGIKRGIKAYHSVLEELKEEEHDANHQRHKDQGLNEMSSH